jgi:transposase
MPKERTVTNKKKPIEYTKEFQENAVRLSKMHGRTVASVSDELKIPAWKLRSWVKGSKEKLERSSDVDELIKRDREIALLKEENEILKKAAAYFAKCLK